MKKKIMKKKILYLWDVANTLFPEKWDKTTGFENYDEYVKSLGYDLNTIDPLVYEKLYYKPYRHGFYQIKIADGFRKVLSWTKNNEIFTTGNKEQINWRAEYFLEKGLFDVRPYFKKINNTFDFANTNKKTKEMIVALFKNKMADGYTEIVYTDDKLENCLLFFEAGKEVENLKIRIYHIKNDNLGIRNKDYYWGIGNLYDLMENEKKMKI